MLLKIIIRTSRGHLHSIVGKGVCVPHMGAIMLAAILCFVPYQDDLCLLRPASPQTACGISRDSQDTFPKNVKK